MSSRLALEFDITDVFNEIGASRTWAFGPWLLCAGEKGFDLAL